MAFSLLLREAYETSAVGRDQHSVLGEHVAATEAAAVGEHRTVLAQQQPAVGAEGPMEPHGVRRDGRGERRTVAPLIRPSMGRSAVPIKVRSVAYAASAGANSSPTAGVRIQNSNCGDLWWSR